MQNLKPGGAERVSVTMLQYLDKARFNPELVIIESIDGQLYRDLPEELSIVFIFVTASPSYHIFSYQVFFGSSSQILFL